MTLLLIIAVLIVGMFIWAVIHSCKTELKYRNVLLEQQNEILKQQNK